MTHPCHCGVPVLIGLLASAAPAADVWKVPSQMANIQLAINVAAPGDVVLVAPGTYTQVVVADGKGITLVADGAANLATLEVRNLPADQVFVLDGFTLDLPDVFAGPDIPFIAEDNAGALRLADCTFLGDPGIAGNWVSGITAYDGTAGALVVNSTNVSIHGCTFVGGDGAHLFDEDFESTATSGGPGLRVDASRVDVQDSLLDGGRGGTQGDSVWYGAGNGGSGVHASGDSHVQVSGCTLIGGDGGSADCDFFTCGAGGDGGDGIHQVGANSVAWVRAGGFFPGSGGWDGDFNGTGSTGVLVDGGSSTTFTERYRDFDVGSPVRQGGLATLAFDGMPGDGVLLFGGLAAGFNPKAANQGTFLLGTPLLLTGIFLGTVPASGSFDVPSLIPELGPGIDALDLHLQAVIIDGPQALLAPARVLTLLDGAF